MATLCTDVSSWRILNENDAKQRCYHLNKEGETVSISSTTKGIILKSEEEKRLFPEAGHEAGHLECMKLWEQKKHTLAMFCLMRKVLTETATVST